jgi:hypothetical protein
MTIQLKKFQRNETRRANDDDPWRLICDVGPPLTKLCFLTKQGELID